MNEHAKIKMDGCKNKNALVHLYKPFFHTYMGRGIYKNYFFFPSRF